MKKRHILYLGFVLIGLLLIMRATFNVLYAPTPTRFGPKHNMHLLQLALDSFSRRTNNKYPVSLSIPAYEILYDMGIKSGSSGFNVG